MHQPEPCAVGMFDKSYAVFGMKGTFLVRPGLSLAGCMVISAAMPGGACKHMALDGTQLHARSLEVGTTS